MKEENTTTNPIVGNKATELAMEVWSYIFALKNSAKKTLRDDNNKEVDGTKCPYRNPDCPKDYPTDK